MPILAFSNLPDDVHRALRARAAQHGPELWRIAPAPGVLAWVDAQDIETLYLSAVTVAELRFGIACPKAAGARSIRSVWNTRSYPPSRAASCPSISMPRKPMRA